MQTIWAYTDGNTVTWSITRHTARGLLPRMATSLTPLLPTPHLLYSIDNVRLAKDDYGQQEAIRCFRFSEPGGELFVVLMEI